MRRMILLGAIMAACLCSRSQIVGNRLYPSATPSDKDTIKSFLTLIMQGSVTKQSSGLSFHDDTILYASCYQKTNVQSEGYVYDTVAVGPLSAGVYHLVLVVNRTPGNADTYCEDPNIQTRAYDTIVTVSKYTGIAYASGTQLQAVLLSSTLMQLHAPYTGTASVQVFDAAGRQCYMTQRQVTEGKNELALDMPELPNGLYIYHIQLGEQRRVLKYVKQ